MRHRYSNGAVVVMTVLLLAAVVAFALLSLRNEPASADAASADVGAVALVLLARAAADD